MTREAIQIETNRQLRLLNRKKGKPTDGTGPGSRTELTDKGCRVHRGSQVAEKTGRGKTGSRYSEPGESVIFKTMTRPLGDWVLMEYD